jgi:hypothetical protein
VGGGVTSQATLDSPVKRAVHLAATTEDPIEADNASRETLKTAVQDAGIKDPTPETLDQTKTLMSKPELLKKIEKSPESGWDDAAKLAMALAPALAVLAGYALGGRTGALIGGVAMFEGYKVYGEVTEKEKLASLKKGGIAGGKIVSYAGPDGKTYLGSVKEDSSGKPVFSKITDPAGQPIPDGKADILALKAEEHGFIERLTGTKAQNEIIKGEQTFANREGSAQSQSQRDAIKAEKQQQYKKEMARIDADKAMNLEDRRAAHALALENARSGNDMTEAEIKAGYQQALKKTAPGVNPKSPAAQKGLSRGENWPPQIKKQVDVLSTKLGKQKGFANDLAAANEQLQRLYKQGNMKDFGVAGSGMLKMLNSQENPDAIGTQEEKRIGGLLQSISTPLSPGGEFRLGKDYKGFMQQVKNKLDLQQSSAKKTQGSLDALIKPYAKSSDSAAPAAAESQDTIKFKTPRKPGVEVLGNGAVYIIQADGLTGMRKK